MKSLFILTCGLIFISISGVSAQTIIAQKNLKSFWIPKDSEIKIDSTKGKVKKYYAVVYADTTSDGKVDIKVIVPWTNLASRISENRRMFPEKNILIENAEIVSIRSLWLIMSDSAKVSSKNKIR